MANVIINKKMDNYEKNRRAAETARLHEDRLKGLSRTKGAQRGDFKMCRELDKAIIDYRRFKSSSDRDKIKKEYFAIEKEYRDNRR